jgi:hypothetical protein
MVGERVASLAAETAALLGGRMVEKKVEWSESVKAGQMAGWLVALKADCLVVQLVHLTVETMAAKMVGKRVDR